MTPFSMRTLGHFTTSYSILGEHRTRAVNIEVAANAVNGATIAPGQTFSFNETVGERTAAFGYERSIVLRDGAIQEGMGGGTCQVASTIHAAALLAGLDIVQRSPHSRPSGYIRMGLDATVVFPRVDLKLRNLYGARVVLRVVRTRGILRAWFEGENASRPDVLVTSEIVERTLPPRTIEHDVRLSLDVVTIKTYGIPGYRVVRTRSITEAGTARTDQRIDTYPPVAELVEVHPDFNLERLGLRAPVETHEGELRPPTLQDDPNAKPPLPVQLHPIARVQLDNNL